MFSSLVKIGSGLFQIIGRFINGGSIALLIHGKADFIDGELSRIKMVNVGEHPPIFNQNALGICLSIGGNFDGVAHFLPFPVDNVKLDNPLVFSFQELCLQHLAVLTTGYHGSEHGNGNEHPQYYQRGNVGNSKLNLYDSTP